MTRFCIECQAVIADEPNRFHCDECDNERTEIKGRDIRRGDVIQSAAMKRPHKVVAAWPSSTGNTVEIETAIAPKMADGTYGEWQTIGVDYRIGMGSKVKRFPEMSERG